jgi:hypothetical protein
LPTILFAHQYLPDECKKGSSMKLILKTFLLLADCVLPAFPSNGNVTCGNLLPEGNDYRLIYGQSCLLTCRAGFVSLELRESRLVLFFCYYVVVVDDVNVIVIDTVIVIAFKFPF